MTYTINVITMRGLLEVPKKSWTLDWAHNICTTGRFLHKDVWTCPLERGYVKKTVVPLFTKADKVLASYAKSKDLNTRDKKLIEEFIRNNKCRKRNVTENFLHGKRSALLPDDELNGRKKAHA